MGLGAELSLAGTKAPRVSGAVRNHEEETPKSKSQSAVGEEWEVCKNKKHQIKRRNERHGDEERRAERRRVAQGAGKAPV